jgi:alkylation response protein AidB-like acyl-CoA dehydrogenase
MEASSLLGIQLTPQQMAFRSELCAWLDAHLVGEYLAFGGRGRASSDEGFDLRQRWERELADGHWLGLGIPAGYGGRGLGLTEQIVFAYECARARAPYRLSIQGTDMLGPTLVAFGTEAQKRRFLPSILAADVIWCQGFSEPEAGSDLAGVRTRAALQGDTWVLNGQKIWTTFGHYADWIYVLCRTDTDAPKHHGLSLLLVPLDQPGVEVRPIRNMADESDFCEVFFSDARTSADLVVGPVNAGWKVALGTLGFERGTATLPYQMKFEREVGALITLARQRQVGPALRDRLARAYIGVRILGFNNQRNLTALVRGDGTLGPESSISKLYWASWHRDLGELGVELLGAEGMCDAGPHHDLLQTFLLSRAETIYGGTNQIQRNTIGERVLGLPREPR